MDGCDEAPHDDAAVAEAVRGVPGEERGPEAPGAAREGTSNERDDCVAWLWKERRGRRMTTVVLDTNIYDKIVERGITDDLVRLVKARRLRILTTHVQQDELARIADVDKKAAVLRVPGEVVPTAGAIYGVSRNGEARYGAGEAGGLDISDVQKGKPKHSKDALIAVTAATEGCILVTQDADLAKRVPAKASKTQVWDFERFAAHVAELLSRLP